MIINSLYGRCHASPGTRRHISETEYQSHRFVQLLSYNEALAAVLANTEVLPQKNVALRKLYGHFLAEPVIARFGLPLFDNSAVDGFGVLVADLQNARETTPAQLKLLGEIRAGSDKSFALESGTAVKILTGARVPASVEAVVMKEYCQEQNGSVRVLRSATAGENIRRAGVEFAKGAQILPSGLRITPPIVGLLATLGYKLFAVHDKPKVSVVVTGDELIQPGKKLGPGEIYDSNSYALEAAITALGINGTSVIHALDTRKETKAAFKQAFAESDVIISSGGVSVGDHDYVKEILEEMNVRTVFWRVKIKPGKPIYFGALEMKGSQIPKLIFGLPGNPVSVLVTFHQFVKPALLKMMGGKKEDAAQFCAINQKHLKKVPGRLDLVRGRLSCTADGHLKALATTGQDSHMLSGLAFADCLIHFGEDAEYLEEGRPVPIDLISWTE